MRGEPCRSRMLADALLIVQWLAERRSEFTVEQFDALPTASKRTRYRWLAVLEGCGLIEVGGASRAITHKGRRGMYGRTAGTWVPARRRAA